MNYSFFSIIRDILLLSILFFLGKIAFERTLSFIKLHENSIIHELDRSFIDQIYTTQRQLHLLQQYAEYTGTFNSALTEIKEQLTSIEEKYIKNSPSLVLLGPIGAAAIVTKEEKLQIKLLNVVDKLNKIFTALTNQTDKFDNLLNSSDKSEKTVHTIDNILNANKKLIHLYSQQYQLTP